MSHADSTATPNRILLRMRDRLFAGLLTGPNLNCRPHSSRQRIDVSHLSRLDDLSPEEMLRQLLGKKRQARLTARVDAPPAPVPFAPRPGNELAGATANDDVRKAISAPDGNQTADSTAPGEDRRATSPAEAGTTSATSEPLSTSEERSAPDPARDAWLRQQLVLKKLRSIAEDAKVYEQDTGVHVLNVGFPLLSLPAASGGKSGWGTRRVLAPIAFVPVLVTIRSGATIVVDLACRGDGVDAVVPNPALLAWLQQQHGDLPTEFFADEEGSDPWREIAEIVRVVADRVELPVPEFFRQWTANEPHAERAATASSDAAARDENASESKERQTPRLDFNLTPIPKADDAALARPAILTSAVLGLFPMNNQGLLRDTLALAGGEPVEGPITSFLDVAVDLESSAPANPAPEVTAEPAAGTPPLQTGREMAGERFVAPLDPCQSRAVRLARQSRGLVIHGPPGTGKSQTITNIIGDHLARGERVLMVCDKRTALDVVANRLEHLGLGKLAALIHDPQRDQRDLYRAIREQLELLSHEPEPKSVAAALSRVDRELQKVHAELTETWKLLMQPDNSGQSFHDLAGRWLAAGSAELEPKRAASATAPLRLADFDSRRHELEHLFDRAVQIDLPRCAWQSAAGLTLAEFLTRPLDALRQQVQTCLDAATRLDATADAAIPPFRGDASPLRQAEARGRLADQLEQLQRAMPAGELAARASLPMEVVRRLRQELAAAEPMLTVLRRGPLDAEMSLLLRGKPLPLATLIAQATVLEAWLSVSDAWYGFLFFGRRSQAAAVLTQYGLPVSSAVARRLLDYLQGVRARVTLQAVMQGLHAALGQPRRETATVATDPLAGALPPDDALERSLADLTMLFDVRVKTISDPACEGLSDPLMAALTESGSLSRFVSGLRRSRDRAESLERLDRALAEARLFAQPWRTERHRDWLSGASAAPVFEKLAAQFEDLDDVLRIRQQVGNLPTGWREAVGELLKVEPMGVSEQSPPASPNAFHRLEAHVLSGELSARVQVSPALQQLDPGRLDKSLHRYRELEQQKQGLVRDAILGQWLARQQERLLVGTGSRLNGQGADLRRRLTLRGERAMRLRQVIANGLTIAGGDPLFDLRPLWMASPETVAQIFPRQAMFDAVIFDEASQCRLEEALPVLTRAKRVVIAGDPKQLPPTRFFESTLQTSEEDDAETEQELFEAHQGEIEDLLEGALGLRLPQCYLDVHYRSRHADLIAFSNREFYSSRLQPIPGHPARRPAKPPILLYEVGGTYQERQNPVEAERVGQIVRELLARPEPPSIGIACFNLNQRDLIVEELDRLAADDSEFAEKLAITRERRGEASFEGLFVKNLENVQGDERDELIISTTYGPDARGRFYRRFGPLGRDGGGRRLNVLVTRARETVHLVTSIPAEAYRALPPVPAGQVPGGGWLLFAYLAFARKLQEAYGGAPAQAVQPISAVRRPSAFAEAFRDWLAATHQQESAGPWGNDGFCVDLALHASGQPGQVSVGVLCDGTRYPQAEDPVAWDVFRAGILESAGWKLHRLWTPAFVRDPQRQTQALLKAASRTGE